MNLIARRVDRVCSRTSFLAFLARLHWNLRAFGGTGVFVVFLVPLFNTMLECSRPTAMFLWVAHVSVTST